VDVVTVPGAAKMHFLTPTYRPAGGVVKLFDYLVHGLELGYDAEVHCPYRTSDQEPLFSIRRFSELPEHPKVRFHSDLRVGIGPDDWVVFSWPPHYEEISRRMGIDLPHERVIHLVQNTRHANPTFTDGYALRLLARPMARIMVADAVMDACQPHLNPESLSATIVEAHDWRYFYRWREGGLGDPLRVGYTTWKSDVGTRVEEAIGERVSFQSIGHVASWEELRTLLHWCDVFLCCPGPEEGFYLVGLEALAAGALIVTPDVGGNRAYCRFGENCVRVGLEEVDDYVAAIDDLRRADAESIGSMRRRGYETLENHRLEREREAFGRFLFELSGRCAARTPRWP
jgi:hypothetical protein